MRIKRNLNNRFINDSAGAKGVFYCAANAQPVGRSSNTMRARSYGENAYYR